MLNENCKGQVLGIDHRKSTLVTVNGIRNGLVLGRETEPDISWEVGMIWKKTTFKNIRRFKTRRKN